MNVGTLLSFVAGVFSFLSPCVLALAPGYVFMLTGMVYQDGGQSRSTAGIILRGAMPYILGFSLVFVVLGSAASGVGQIFRAQRELISHLSGFLVIVFGLHISGLLKLSFLNRQATPLQGSRLAEQLASYKGSQVARSIGCFVTGIAFAFGWTPCVGPILGSILTIAGSTDTMWQGIQLLIAYSLGLAIPFLILALFLERLRPLLPKVLAASEKIKLLAGLLLVVVGILMLTDSMYLISSKLLIIFGSWSPDTLVQRILGTSN